MKSILTLLAIWFSLVWLSGCDSLPRTGDFRPSTTGKKLLHYRGPDYAYMKDHTAEMEQIAFDGLILGGAMAFRDRLSEAELFKWADQMAAVPFRRYTDNFYLCYSYPGKDAEAFDWFDDLPWIAENWRIMAATAKRAGFKGICFDSEYYEGMPLFGYLKARHRETRSLEEYQAQVRRQAAAMMRAVNREYPDITILFLFGYTGGFCGVPQHARSSQKNYTLISAFVDGLLSECGRDARIFDMHEQAFSFRVPGSYARARAMMTDVAADRSVDPARYRANHRAGFSFWADCWENAAEGRAFSVDDLEKNYYTPAEFTASLHHALAYSDGYAWMWPGVFDWWKGTARTVDEAGKTITRPIPQGYIDGLRDAHNPTVPEPPRQRRPNTYRNMPASTQEGWEDEKTFADLWTTHEFVADLPEEWSFRIDPDEVGEKEHWERPGAPSAGWSSIRIREFWENQGYSPYDGQAWYRLSYTPPNTPAGRKVYLAFGGVSDEATVYVNGRQRYASRYGENIRHERFLVDITSEASGGKPLTLAVRVWNTGWCGGIWKNVKLVTAR